MPKKLTIEFIRIEFKKEGYKLLTKIYKNNHQRLDYICPNGHQHFTSLINWRKGVRCVYCCGKHIPVTIERIRKQFEERGYTLLTTEYRNDRQRLDCICSEGHKCIITWGSFGAGHGCPHCAGNAKLTIEFIRSEFAKEGYILLTTEYRNNSQKLDYICPKGHRHSISWHKWKFGRRCPKCSAIRIGEKLRLNIEFIRSEFEKEGYTLLTTEYKDNNQKLDYICPKGHRHSISWGSWQSGSRCYYCHGTIKPTIEFIRSEFEKEGYELLTTVYKNGLQKLEYICFVGHEHAMSWGNWKNGYRCPTCAVIKNSGATHYNWQGGISKEPYCQDWTTEFKNFIKERDTHKCLNPYCNSKNPGDLTVHHIDYDKKNCDPENLITVCRSCNSKANTDRVWHTNWYQAVLNMRYNYFNNKEYK